jgi:hypothetical protein
MQQSQYYKSTPGANKYAWAPYPDQYSYPYMCEKPQSLYACNNMDPPPAPDTPSCVPSDNDTTYCPLNQTSCYFYHQTSMTNASAMAKCTALGGYLVSYGDASEQLQVENYFSVGPLLGLQLLLIRSNRPALNLRVCVAGHRAAAVRLLAGTELGRRQQPVELARR